MVLEEEHLLQQRVGQGCLSGEDGACQWEQWVGAEELLQDLVEAEVCFQAQGVEHQCRDLECQRKHQLQFQRLLKPMRNLRPVPNHNRYSQTQRRPMKVKIKLSQYRPSLKPKHQKQHQKYKKMLQNKPNRLKRRRIDHFRWQHRQRRLLHQSSSVLPAWVVGEVEEALQALLLGQDSQERGLEQVQVEAN